MAAVFFFGGVGVGIVHITKIVVSFLGPTYLRAKIQCSVLQIVVHLLMKDIYHTNVSMWFYYLYWRKARSLISGATKAIDSATTNPQCRATLETNPLLPFCCMIFGTTMLLKSHKDVHQGTEILRCICWTALVWVACESSQLGSVAVGFLCILEKP